MKHRVRKVHFVGIGGVGMSGIAEVLVQMGFAVSGSDLTLNPAVERLRQMGVTVYLGHDAAHLQDADAVVVSSAIAPDNPEWVEARKRRIPVVPRAEMLAELMRFRQGIAIAGTHGKTTTTSLVATILAEAGFDPTFVIGGRLLAAGSNAKLGSGAYLVAEADESDASFLHLSPVIAVVTNIDADHMATYGHDFERLKAHFLEFLHRLPFWGVAVLCWDEAAVREIAQRCSRVVLSYGFHPEAMVRAEEVVVRDGKTHFTLVRRNGEPRRTAVTMSLLGTHNVRNALAAAAVASELGVDDETIARALATFQGVARRFERHGWFALTNPTGARVRFELIDDYGHHPRELAATIEAARLAYPNRRLVLVFQPHRYTRTRDCFDDFAQVLSEVDGLVLTEVYPAGEEPIPAADGRALARAVRLRGRVEPVFVDGIDAIPEALAAVVQDHDIVLSMGAGSIGTLPRLLAPYAEQA
ncbi:UDP-N-acetylmuramate--L-alanine ligase [Hydrogenophilus thiooxidans]|uniref:UDP-N-acetylmuramate--L-alanine ligase n=1 Tax=Hydrogenophilus thiooxidans TaxID=2820326 RepID=UPI001C240E95|nr:UDP-N-acetylmuramate--L-alanine ligase [Hydrogenophilus thiooxidans]